MAQASYRAIAIGAPDAYTELRGVSDTGVVVGYTDPSVGVRTPFEWVDGALHRLPMLPSTAGKTNGLATAISPNGEFIAGVNVVNGSSEAVLWHDGTVRGLGSLPGGGFSNPYAVNDHGVVVGISGTPNCLDDSGCSHAVMWGRRGVIHDLGMLPGDERSYAVAVNADQVVVGRSTAPSGVSRPVVWRHRRIHALATLGKLGGPGGEADAINSAGVIAGTLSTSTRYRAVVWKDHEPHLLATPRHGNTAVAGINAHGTVSGELNNRYGGHVVKWTHDGTLVRLQALLIESGWRLMRSGPINNSGWIASGGSLLGVDRAALLQPVQSP
jgi:hypothetical protein